VELKHYFDIMNSVLCKRYLILIIQKYSLPGCAVFIIMTELIKTNDLGRLFKLLDDQILVPYLGRLFKLLVDQILVPCIVAHTMSDQ
jgi:hypothetical protein